MTVLHQDIGDTSGGLGGDTSAPRLGRWLPMNPSIPVSVSRSRSGPMTRPAGAVSTFCAEHGISRKSFYELRKRAKADGPAAVLEPRTRRPRSSPSKLTDEVKAQAVQVRAALEASGLDHGPISVHDKMHAMGLDPVPSTASLARIFREAGVARLEPKKKPRSAWRRFVYPAPNACWQLDATEYVLTGGRKCVIFQLIDDHSRYAVASHVAWGETAKAAIAVFDKAVAAHGVPQRLLSDNGLALNPSRRGFLGQLVEHVSAWASRRSPASRTSRPPRARTNASTRPCSATSTSSHSPTRWPSCRPRSTRSTTSTTPSAPTRDYPAASHPDGMGGHPEGRGASPQARPALSRASPWHRRSDDPGTAAARDLPAGTRVKRLTTAGTFTPGQGHLQGRRTARDFEQVLVITDGDDKITVTDLDGEILIEHTRPAPGVTYVGNGRPRGPRPKTPASVTEVLTHQLSPMS